MSKIITLPQISKFIEGLYGKALHKKRQYSLALGILGTLRSRRLSSACIGRSLANERGTTPKHCIKQIDRLAGNAGMDMDICFEGYIRYVIGSRSELVVSLDWTEYGGDLHSRLCLNLVTHHGRATPLFWMTVEDKSLKHRRSRYERRLLKRFHSFLPEDVHVIVLADRGFMNLDLYRFIVDELHWDVILRMRGNTYISHSSVGYCQVSNCVPKNGRIATFTHALVTAKEKPVGSVVCLKRRKMKESWCLLTNFSWDGVHTVSLYEKRFTCEEHFRDEKDDRFGAGFKETRVSTTARRDRFCLIHAIATLFLTFLGHAGELIGYDRKLRANTLKIRTHSLYRQGKEYAMGVMASYIQEFKVLFRRLLREHLKTTEVFAII